MPTWMWCIVSWSVAPAALVRLHSSKDPFITFHVTKNSEKCGSYVSREKTTHGQRRIKYANFISQNRMWFPADRLLSWGSSQRGSKLHILSHPWRWARKCLLPSHRQMRSGCQVTLLQSMKSCGYVLKLLSFVCINIDLSITWIHLSTSDRS